MIRLRCDSPKPVPDENNFAVECFLIVKLAAAVSELADRRGLRQHSLTRICPVKPPLARLWIVETERQSLQMARGRCELNLLQITAAVPNLSSRYRSITFNP